MASLGPRSDVTEPAVPPVFWSLWTGGMRNKAHLVTEASTATSVSWLQPENAPGGMALGCSRGATTNTTPLPPHAAQLEHVVRFGDVGSRPASPSAAIAVIVVVSDTTRSRVAQAKAAIPRRFGGSFASNNSHLPGLSRGGGRQWGG